MNITTGYRLDKPVATQEQCDAYAAMAQAVNDHNAACQVGDALWIIEDGETSYTVAEGEVVQEPETVEIPPTNSELDKRVDALETANDDIILMMADLIGGINE